ncbi:lysophosphatidylserine lipase ABHD12-like [Pollicipes pollicipes]|uniref:lysophosphatidylserine lipase ABHD12-like n=1 Tax=Pollicipes pollicipes TaxID=41117 RepID=UPI001884F541|nr:lysophosphatidylserine lipase ABHD12-like [Pollicipes pollicipes]
MTKLLFYLLGLLVLHFGAHVHVLPEPEVKVAPPAEDNPDYYERSLQGGAPVVMYLHGISGSRALLGRVQVYQTLRNLGYHVIAVDYRYGDSSSGPLSEDGLVADSRCVYEWLRRRTADSPILVWGHSLGSGVAVHLVSALCRHGQPPAGLVLEAPFDNLAHEVSAHFLATFHRDMPGFHWFFVAPLKVNGMAFESDVHIAGVTVPTLILHAEDDVIIPCRLGVQLHRSALRYQPTHQVRLHTFEARFRYGHDFIWRSPRLPVLLSHRSLVRVPGVGPESSETTLPPVNANELYTAFAGVMATS